MFVEWHRSHRFSPIKFRFNEIYFKIPEMGFEDTDKIILKCVLKGKVTRIGRHTF
jgi:hypothetical protein